MSQYGPPGGGYPGQSPDPWRPGQPAEESYDQPADPWGDQDPWAGAQTSGQPGGHQPVSGQPGGYPPVSGQPGGYPVSGQPGGYPTSTGQPGYPQSGGYPPAGGQAGGYPSHSGQSGGYPPAPGQGDRFAVPVSPGGYDSRYPGGGAPGYPTTRAYEAGRAPAAAPGTEWAPVGPVGGRRGNKGLIAALVALAVVVFGGGATAIYLLGREDPNDKVAGPEQTVTAPPSGDPTPSDDPVTESPAPQSSTDARFVKAGQCVKNEGSRQEPRLAITSCTAKTWKVLKRYDGMTTGEDDARKKCSKVEGYTDWYFFDSPLDVLDYVLCLKSVD